MAELATNLGLSTAYLMPPPVAITWFIEGSDEVEAGDQKWLPMEGGFETALKTQAAPFEPGIKVSGDSKWPTPSLSWLAKVKSYN